MKNIVLSLALVAVLFASCDKKQDTPAPIVYNEENPLASYITQTNFSKSTPVVNSGNYEFGLRFSPIVKGKINAIIVKIPDNATNLRVTIWKVPAKAVAVIKKNTSLVVAPSATDLATIYKTEVIPSVTKDTEQKFAITPLELEKDAQYMISMNANDWYSRNKPDNTPATYPIIAGNIKILDYRWSAGTAQTYPTNVDLKYYAGDLSFVFQQTN